MQLADGMVPWYPDRHADPWNHVEAAMALAAGGRWAEVERAFEWLAAKQLPEGSWCAAYVPDGVTEPRRDPNTCAYLATGAWWCAQLSQSTAPLETSLADAEASYRLVPALPAAGRRDDVVG